LYQSYGVGHQPVVNIGRRKKRAAQFYQSFMPESIYSNVQMAAPVFQPEKDYQPASDPVRSYQSYGLPVYPVFFPAYPTNGLFSHQEKKSDNVEGTIQKVEAPPLQTPDDVQDTTSPKADSVPVETASIDSKVMRK